MAVKRVEVAFPEGFEDHPISCSGAFEKAGDVEARIGGEDRADAGPGGRDVGKVTSLRRRRLGCHRLSNLRRGARVRVGRPEDRLLLMARPLAEHAVEAKPDEQCGQSQNDDNGQR